MPSHNNCSNCGHSKKQISHKCKPYVDLMNCCECACGCNISTCDKNLKSSVKTSSSHKYYNTKCKPYVYLTDCCQCACGCYEHNCKTVRIR